MEVVVFGGGELTLDEEFCDALLLPTAFGPYVVCT
jgi:hypothetical protein